MRCVALGDFIYTDLFKSNGHMYTRVSVAFLWRGAEPGRLPSNTLLAPYPVLPQGKHESGHEAP